MQKTRLGMREAKYQRSTSEVKDENKIKVRGAAKGWGRLGYSFRKGGRGRESRRSQKQK